MNVVLQSAAVVWTAAIVFALIIIFLVVLTVRAHRSRVTTGNEGIVGERGRYKGNGQVQVHGELWRIEESNALEAGDRVEVTGIKGLYITVRKI